MREKLKYLASALVGVAVCAAIAAYWFRPEVLRIAVGPVGSSDVRVSVAYLQALQREGAGIRLRLVLAEGPADAAAKLEAGRADLAIARSDIAMPARTSTVAIMRREAVFFITRPGSEITQIADLKGRTVGDARPGPANARILGEVLARYDLEVSDLIQVGGTPAELLAAVQEGTVDALFFVSPPNERVIRAALQAFPKAEGKNPGFLAVSDAEAIQGENPAFDTIEIVRGAFGGNPILPESSTTTLAVSHRLVAKNDLSDSLVAELTRLIVTLRPQIVGEAPAANQIDLPSTEDRAARLPTHPGAVAYIDGETKTFFERYGDYIYLAIMGISILGSGLAALFSVFARRPEAPQPDRLMAELVREMDRVREAGSIADLEALEEEAETLIARLLQASTGQGGDTGQVAAVALLVSEFRHSVARRRHRLQIGSESPTPPDAKPASKAAGGV